MKLPEINSPEVSLSNHLVLLTGCKTALLLVDVDVKIADPFVDLVHRLIFLISMRFL